MLAKGRLLGVQFLALLEDGLYFEMGKHANALAEEIRKACVTAGYPFFIESPSNQIFVIMPDEELNKLSENYGFCYQQRIDELHSAVRICTSWATSEENVQKLVNNIAGGGDTI